MDNVQNELLGFFLEEASEHLTVLEDGLLRLEKNPSDLSLIDELFRSAHTIKGSAALVKLNTTSKVAHRLEDAFEAVRDTGVAPTPPRIDAMLFALDQIKGLVQLARDNEPEPEDVLEQVERALAEAVAEESAEPVAAASDEGQGLGPLDATPVAEAVEAEPVLDAVAVDDDAAIPMAEALPDAEGFEAEALAVDDDAVEVLTAEPLAHDETIYEATAVDPGTEEDSVLPAEVRDEESSLPEAGESDAKPEPHPLVPPAGSPSQAEAKPLRAYVKERRMLGRRLDDVDVASGGVIKIGSGKLDQMMNVLGEITITKNHLMDQLAVIERLREEIDFAGQRLIREVGTFAERYAYSLPEQVKYKDNLLSEFMELEFDRYDELNLFSRKLQEITNDVNEGLRTLGDFFTGFNNNVANMDRMIGEMKERISDARMIEAGTLFQRFTRTVRDLSRQTGRKIRFLVAGGETPLDRVVYDGLFEPLLHIIRNAVAHGFEPVEERLELGKPEIGTIRLSARREGNTIVIEVRDDGRGIHFEKIRDRAIERGFMAPDEKLSPRELLRFLFMPGFSTAQATDQTSGRGVGLDIVKDRLALLNGTVSILTKKGRGTVFRLRLPVSLVIINVVQFRVAGQAFVVPSNLVAEIASVPRSEMRGDGKVKVRDALVRSMDLNEIFGMPADANLPERFAIVTLVSGVRVAILVDEIVSQEDTIIKPFGSFLRELRYYSGTSVAGDGTLRPVINPSRVVEERRAAPVAVEPVLKETSRPVVLVVDDSLSVRKIASLLLKNHGFEVKTASHGLEALDLLDETRVDFVLTDLEMPVMHGYELLGELSRRGILQTVPVVVLTSRGGDLHRQKAFDLGATDYLVKPFEEDSLIGTVQKHLRKPQGTA